ncbi:MAG TPA: trehalase family glycosidase [Terracidiphilus sp.]|nr:trehalase family glycosidase [Terracidiphilus sp.]
MLTFHLNRAYSAACATATLLLLSALMTKVGVAQPSDQDLLAGLTTDFAKLAPQTIRPASGYIRYPYLIPAGYYNQMWDWDGFFIGAHWANQNADNAKLLRDWVLSFASSADPGGYVSGCITPSGPRPIFGKFAMKPFLAQGAVIASEQLHDYEWIRPVFPAMVKIAEYRRKTQYDDRWGLWFWDNAMQSGADNNPALSNQPKDESAILAVDASVWAMREYRAMALIARKLGYGDLADRYKEMAGETRKAILKHLWVKDDAIFLNRWRDDGKFVRVISWSSFVPLADGMLPQKDAQRMIREHLLNPAEMRSNFGFRSLAKSDPAYNNQAIINPYSNWQGPVWINANFLDWIALRKYGFTAESKWVAEALAAMLRQDIARWGSMHEDYSAETGEGLAPTPAQSPKGKFAGFVGWNLLAQDMLQCEVTGEHCITMEIPAK